VERANEIVEVKYTMTWTKIRLCDGVKSEHRVSVMTLKAYPESKENRESEVQANTNG
jgi:hypothetical protein